MSWCVPACELSVYGFVGFTFFVCLNSPFRLLSFSHPTHTRTTKQISETQTERRTLFLSFKPTVFLSSFFFFFLFFFLSFLSLLCIHSSSLTITTLQSHFSLTSLLHSTCTQSKHTLPTLFPRLRPTYNNNNLNSK